MRFLVVIAIVILMISSANLAGAEEFPQFNRVREPQATKALTPEQQKMVEAYLPPPPIRHSWPGGYRVLLHEIMNTLMEHMTGHY